MDKVIIRIIVYLFFIAVVILGIMDQTIAAIRVAGVLGIIVGIYWIIKRQVGYGIRGRPPMGYFTGTSAVIWGIVVILIGVFLIVSPESVIKFSSHSNHNY